MNAFQKMTYTPAAPLNYHGLRREFPEPVYPDEMAVHAYWQAWRLVERNLRWPMPGSPFVSNYIDTSFCDLIFLWDTCFITMFAAYGFGKIPAIESLDNLYAVQLESGEIVRSVSIVDGSAHRWSVPGTPSSLNHPLLAWAELESYAITADVDRLKLVYEPLQNYYASFEAIFDPESGLYRADWTSMDNSPRNQHMFVAVDPSCEMVLFARQLAQIAGIIGRHEDIPAYEQEADALAARINEKMWDEETGFYFDLDKEGEQVKIKSVAAYWAMLAGVASPEQAARLVEHLEDPATFNRKHRVPTLAADEEGYSGSGHYWRGGVWAPTNTMVIRALEGYGYDRLAGEIARNHWENVLDVFQSTQTFWEMYAADKAAPGETGNEPFHRVCPAFTGWSAMAPIRYFIEYILGIRIDAPRRRVIWTLPGVTEPAGIRYLRFADVTTDLLVFPPEGDEAAGRIEIEANENFELCARQGVREQCFAVTKGKNTFILE